MSRMFSISKLFVLAVLIQQSRADCCLPKEMVLKCPNRHFNKPYCQEGACYKESKQSLIPYNVCDVYDCNEEFVDTKLNLCENGEGPTAGVCVDVTQPVSKPIWNYMLQVFEVVIPGTTPFCNARGCECNFKCKEGPVNMDMSYCPPSGSELKTGSIGRGNTPSCQSSPKCGSV